MTNAWETTYDDVVNVLIGFGVNVHNDFDDEKVDEFIDFQLDHEAVEKAALHGDEMDQQTDYAYEEIGKQLKQAGVL